MNKHKWFGNKAVISWEHYPEMSNASRMWWNHWRLGDRCLDVTIKIRKHIFNGVIFAMPFSKQSYYSDDYDG